MANILPHDSWARWRFISFCSAWSRLKLNTKTCLNHPPKESNSGQKKSNFVTGNQFFSQEINSSPKNFLSALHGSYQKFGLSYYILWYLVPMNIPPCSLSPNNSGLPASWEVHILPTVAHPVLPPPTITACRRKIWDMVINYEIEPNNKLQIILV